jgi:hypothetical protein
MDDHPVLLDDSRMVNREALMGRGCIIGNYEYYLNAINVQSDIGPQDGSTIEISVPEMMKNNPVHEDIRGLFM